MAVEVSNFFFRGSKDVEDTKYFFFLSAKIILSGA